MFIHIKSKHGWRRAGKAFVRVGTNGDRWISGTLCGQRIGIW